MIKPYLFNGNNYDNLNNLALAYQKDFDLGIKDIYTNSKKLIKFIKKSSKDKELVKDIVSYLSMSKYKNNALTFIIFRLSGQRLVVINGYELTFKEYILALKENKDKLDNALFAFLEDYGISKTYAKMGVEPKLTKHSYFIERNFDLDFTYEYLTTYYDFEIVESLNAKVSNIAVNGEECFRRASKLTATKEFQLGIAHKIGFKEAVAMNKEINPLFHAVKLLKSINETEEDSLRELISDTFYWWLLDNYDKYIPLKNEARGVFDKLDEIKKEYNKYQTQIEARKIVNISINLFADMSRSLYLVYLKFVSLYKKGLIGIKKKYTSIEFDFDKSYCKTYICQDFMNGRIVKLYNDNKAIEQEVKYNPLTGEVIENYEEEAPKEENDILNLDDSLDDTLSIDDDSISFDEDKKLDMQIKKMNKYKRFSGFAIFQAITTTILIVIAIALMLIFKDDSGLLGNMASNIKPIFENIIVLVLFGVVVLATIISVIVLNVRIKNTYNMALDARFLTSVSSKDIITPKQEAKYLKLIEKENVIKKYAMRNHRIASMLVLVFVSISFAILALFIGAILKTFIPNLIKNSIYDSWYLYILCGFVVGLLIGLLKKYKGALSIMLSFILVVGLAFLLMIIM